MLKEKPAICCLGYNRPDSMRRLLNSIGKAEYKCVDITLIISIDECDKSDEVQAVAEKFEWKYGEKIIKRYPERLGVRRHTLTVGDFSEKYGSVIYLEDDIVVAPGFYTYTQEALKKYRCDDKIFGIALYNQKWLGTAQTEFIPEYNGADAYLFRGDVSWGQCWIDKQWKLFHEWYDKKQSEELGYNRNVPKSVYLWNTNSSWSKFISFYLAENEKYYVVPYVSFSTCFSDKGVHTGFNSDQCQVPLSKQTNTEFRFFEEFDCVKYDSYFERINWSTDQIAGIPVKDICIDLNGEKYDWKGFKALLTTKEIYKYESIAEYGLNMEPIELNVEYCTPGDDIHLYLVPEDEDCKSEFDKLSVPTSSACRVFHQIGKFRTKEIAKILERKVLNKIKSINK